MTDKRYPAPDPYGLALAKLRTASAQPTPKEALDDFAAQYAAEGLRVLEATTAAVADDVRNDLETLELQAEVVIDGPNYRPPDPYKLALEKIR
jgi:hypothetical protein